MDLTSVYFDGIDSRVVLSKNKLHTPLDHEIELNRTFDGKYYTINIINIKPYYDVNP